MDDGHVWYIVSREEAKDVYYNKDKEVYILHADNSETLCTKHFDFTIADAVYATEFPLYPFNEGDIYYTIEDGVMVESVWDDVSEDLYSPHDKYYSSIHEAKEDPRWDRKSISLI